MPAPRRFILIRFRDSLPSPPLDKSYRLQFTLPFSVISVHALTFALGRDQVWLRGRFTE
jgi:hypothetical protein